MKHQETRESPPPSLNLNGEPLGWDSSTFDPVTRKWSHEYLTIPNRLHGAAINDEGDAI